MFIAKTPEGNCGLEAKTRDAAFEEVLTAYWCFSEAIEEVGFAIDVMEDGRAIATAYFDSDGGAYIYEIYHGK